MTVLHWHSLSVLSLAFSTEGSYLLSGGHECVLVKWLTKTGQKDFKPRLGAPINEITCSLDNTLYVSRHVDNSKAIETKKKKNSLNISQFMCIVFFKIFFYFHNK